MTRELPKLSSRDTTTSATVEFAERKRACHRNQRKHVITRLFPATGSPARAQEGGPEVLPQAVRQRRKGRAQRGVAETLKDDSDEREGPTEPAASRHDEAVTRHGFNLHASVTIAISACDHRFRSRGFATCAMDASRIE